MRKGLLLYNPAAGRYPVRRYVRGIIHPLKEAGWSIEIAETLSGTHATEIAHQAAAEKYDAVFAIGGDGTVGQVASGLLDSEMDSMTIVPKPCGSSLQIMSTPWARPKRIISCARSVSSG